MKKSLNLGRSLKIIISLGLFVFLGISSCQKLEVDELREARSIDFSQLGVKHNYDTPLEALDFEEEDLKDLYLSKLGGESSRLSFEEMEYPTLEEVAALEEENLKKYPDFNEMADEDVEWIKRDFPTLSEQEIAENIEAISEYYMQNLRYDLVVDLAEGAGELRRAYGDYYPYKLCSKEFWFLVWRPTAAIQINKAKSDAYEYADEFYPDMGGWQTKKDAFRHAIWNVLIAKYYGGKKKSIHKGVNMARRISNLHEECNAERDDAEDWDMEMDYHNNRVGRDYFESVAKIKTKRRRFWFKKKWLECPSNSVLKTEIKNRSDRAYKASKDVNAVRRVSNARLVYFKN